MVFFDENGFTRTTKEDGEKIANHLSIEFIGTSKIDGYPMVVFSKTNGIYNFYRKYFEGQLIKMLEDQMTGYFGGQPIPESPYKNDIVIKILKHNPKLFDVSIREEKLKRILKIK